MYSTILALHNFVRWIVFLFGLLAIGQAVLRWRGVRKEGKPFPRMGLFFSISLDIQLLLGALLYFVYSPWALRGVLTQGVAFAMKQGEYRFFAVEHGLFMLLATVFAHMGNALVRKGAVELSESRRVAVYFGLAMAFLLAGTPWWRPLLPGL